MKLSELRDKEPSQEIPKIASSETEMVWISGYWDGALDGMLEYKNSLYWFDMIQESDDWIKDGWFRRYAIVILTSDQIEKELKVHEDFQRYVGTGYSGKNISPPPKFEEGKMDLFYEKHLEYCKSRPFESNEVIGWIEGLIQKAHNTE